MAQKTKAELQDEIRELRQQLYELEGYKHHYEQLEIWVERMMQQDEIPDWRIRGRGIFDQFDAIIAHYRSRHSGMYQKFGAFVEHTIISLRALKMIAKMGYGGTHRWRNSIQDVLCATLDETMTQLLDDKEKDPAGSYFGNDYFSRKDWDFRRICGENQRLAQALQERDKRIEELEASLSG